MARERYLLDESESTIHANIVKPTTVKQKADNWWFYYKRVLAWGIFAGVLVISFIASIVFKTHPDYSIAVMNGSLVPTQAFEIMEAQLAEYADDRNGDGKIVVEILNYALVQDEDGNPYDPTMMEAAYVRFAGDLSVGESMIWIHDEVGYYAMGEEVNGLFKEDFSGDEPSMMSLGEIDAFTNIDFSEYDDPLTPITPEELNEYFNGLRISFRELEGAIENKQDSIEYHTDCEVFFDNLLNGNKISEGAENIDVN